VEEPEFWTRLGQERWRFTLVVGHQAISRDQINWPDLLPSDLSTGWLRLDPRNKTLRVDPLSGHNN
jgi:hypothetical protein